MTRPDTSKLVLPAVAVVVALRLGALLPLDSVRLSYAFLGSFALYLWRRPRLVEVAATFLAAAFLALARVWFRGSSDLLVIGAITPGLFLGLGSLIVLVVPTAWLSGDARRAQLADFGVALAVPSYFILAAVALKLAEPVHPATYDLYLYAFDGTLGFQPSFWMGRTVPHFRWLIPPCVAAYDGLPLGIAFLYGSQRRVRKGPGQVDLFVVFAIVGIAGWLLYQVFPAAGPIYLFRREFPRNPPSLAGLNIQLTPLSQACARNAMPSLHMAWALLMWWTSRRSAIWVRVVCVGFLFFTILTTLAAGEHYLIDLVVAVPFTLAIQAACSTSIPLRKPPRMFGLCLGAGLTLGWLGLLRSLAFLHFGIITSWTLVGATVLVPVVAQRYLTVAESRAGKNVTPAT